MKTVMLIGGGSQEVRSLEFARRLGYRTIVTDRNPDAPCVAVADESYVVDGLDRERLVEIAQDLRGRDELHGVFTLTELVTSVAAVAEATGLLGASVSSAEQCQDKGLAKQAWLASGVSTPDGGVVLSAEEAQAVFERIGGPAIVKPVHGFGAVGVGRLDAANDLDAYFAEVGSGSWVVEEMVEGASHDVNGIFDGDGVFHPQGIADREFVPGTFAEHEVHAPTRLGPAQQAELYELLRSCALALGVTSGPVKGDAILSDGRFVMLEIAPRLHGPKMSLYALPESGRDHWPTFFSVITGGPVLDLPESPPRFFQSTSIPVAPGRIEAIDGVDDVRGWDGVVDVMTFRDVGDVVSPTVNSTDVFGYVLASTDSRDSTRALLERAVDAIRVTVD